jgi:hypothetical protein
MQAGTLVFSLDVAKTLRPAKDACLLSSYSWLACLLPVACCGFPFVLSSFHPFAHSPFLPCFTFARILYINIQKKQQMVRTLLFSILFIVFGVNNMIAQNKGILVSVAIDGKDTLPCITLPTFILIGYPSNASKREINRYTKLVRNIIKVYPYARMAAQKLKEYDDLLVKIPNVKEQKRLMKIAEKQLRKEFGKSIEDLTFSQGILLLKLVDRETSKTTYQIVDELRGSLRAFFYQAIAKLFKYDLKSKYDPKGKDKEIEKIVLLIEKGEL